MQNKKTTQIKSPHVSDAERDLLKEQNVFNSKKLLFYYEQSFFKICSVIEFEARYIIPLGIVGAS